MTAPETLEGWFALHDFRRLDHSAWGRLDATEREKALAEAKRAIGAGRSIAIVAGDHRAMVFLADPNLGGEVPPRRHLHGGGVRRPEVRAGSACCGYAGVTAWP